MAEILLTALVLGACLLLCLVFLEPDCDEGRRGGSEFQRSDDAFDDPDGDGVGGDREPGGCRPLEEMLCDSPLVWRAGCTAAVPDTGVLPGADLPHGDRHPADELRRSDLPQPERYGNYNSLGSYGR